MIDSLKRNIDYLRVSVTDRCNLRCVYCMPAQGVEWMTHDEVLSYEEIVKLCSIFQKAGIKKVKLTGGEPLVRKNLAHLIKSLKKVSKIETVTLTTNGILLEKQLDELIEAGLDAVNISLDTLQPDRFASITRCGGLESVLRGIKKALSYENLTVKINCVPTQFNESEILDIVAMAKNSKLCVRFIEMMPIGLGKEFTYFSEEQITQRIEGEFGKMTPCNEHLGNGPCHYFTLEGFKGRIGFISAISHGFCDQCNRVRLTSAGFLKTCLQYEKGVDLRALLRSGAEESTLYQVIEKTIFEKPVSHQFTLESEQENLEYHNMSQIGG